MHPVGQCSVGVSSDSKSLLPAPCNHPRQPRHLSGLLVRLVCDNRVEKTRPGGSRPRRINGLCPAMAACEIDRIRCDIVIISFHSSVGIWMQSDLRAMAVSACCIDKRDKGPCTDLSHGRVLGSPSVRRRPEWGRIQTNFCSSIPPCACLIPMRWVSNRCEAVANGAPPCEWHESLRLSG